MGCQADKQGRGLILIDHKVKSLLRKIAIGPEGVPLYSREQKRRKDGMIRGRCLLIRLKAYHLTRFKEKGAACVYPGVSLERDGNSSKR